MNRTHDLAPVELDECLGYGVESPDGRIGVVEQLLLTPDAEIEALVVRCGMFRPTTLLVPVQDVERVRADRRSVVVRRVRRD